MPDVATASAPASVGNVSVGFDVLGHSLHGVEDRATVRVLDEPVVRVRPIRVQERLASAAGAFAGLPLEAPANTAGKALLALREALDLPFGLEVELEKGIPLAAGLGGSAASAVAAVVAAAELVEDKPPLAVLYQCALAGEAVASGSAHGDNVAPSLHGGLVFAGRERVVPVNVPRGLMCVVVHPELRLETRRSRAALVEPYELASFVRQSEHLIQFLLGCERGDLELVRAGLQDVLVEPRRAPLIPGLAAVKAAALECGALGAGISGGGPSVFAWFPPQAPCADGARAMIAAFARAGLASEAYESPLAGPSAKVVR